MTPVSRRSFVSGAMVVTAVGATFRSTAIARPGNVLLLYDADLAAGARFASHAQALGGEASRLEGDRVRQVQALLANDPTTIFGVSRHGDEWLVTDVAAQAGYRRLSLIQHRVAGDILPSCSPEGASIATLARLAGGRWPEAFAELAIGGIERCETRYHPAAAEPAFSWVLARG